MGFCEIADLEKFLQIDIPAAKEDSAQRAIDEATAAIQNYCHQQLELVENDVITLDSIGGTRLFLPELPIIEVSEVVEDGETLTVDDDYKVNPRFGIVHRVDVSWASGIQIIEVTYTHGYRLNDDYAVGDLMPEDIVQICARAAARAYQAGLRAEEVAGVPGVQATSLGDYSVQFGSEQSGAGEAVLGASASPILLRSERDLLNRYRVKGC
ncbi:MAG TPA: hypothetical protein VM537_18365 [Anaerolineae bacterium]|nr:hypothetical protein [Anaerolineae bacterium]